MLPIHFQFQSHHQQTLRRFVDMARETATSNGSDKLQIVCARQCLLGSGKRPTPTEAEEEDKVIPQILLSLPEGSCAIPSSESKRLNLLSSCLKIRYNANHVFFMANEGLDIDGRKTFENLKFEKQDEFPGNVVMEPAPSEIWEPEDNTILNFIKSIHPHFQGYSRADGHSESQDVAGESKTREFIKVLKDNGIDYLVAGDDKIEVDDLQTKTIGFIICDLYLLEYIKTRQIYKDLQQKDSNFIGVWIPPLLPEGFGHDSYTRLIQCMPWATFPQAAFTKFIQSPQIFPCFVVLGKDGQIANNDAFDLVLGWGAKTYPFTEHSITQSFSLMESESCLEFLLHGMNIVGRKPMKKKMTFLCAVSPSDRRMNNFEQLPHINGNFELLHVGQFGRWDLVRIPELKQDYEDMLGEYNGRWASLAFWDMVIFWNRCRYLGRKEVYELYKESNMMMESVWRLAKCLYTGSERVVLVDNDGPVTRCGYEVLQMMCESSDEISNGEEMRMVRDELILSLSRGECSPMVKAFFRDEIDNHPQHPHHRISYSTKWFDGSRCNVCSCHIPNSKWSSHGRWRCVCYPCGWEMCRSCGVVYAKQQVQHLMLAKDN